MDADYLPCCSIDGCASLLHACKDVFSTWVGGGFEHQVFLLERNMLV